MSRNIIFVHTFKMCSTEQEQSFDPDTEKLDEK
jgi:hypothetical protein